MSYNKTTWTSGDVITAEKLNNIEDGLEAASAGPSYPSITVTRNDPQSDRYPIVRFLTGACIDGNTLVAVDFRDGTTTAHFIPRFIDEMYQVVLSFPNMSARYQVTSNTMEVTLDEDTYYIAYESAEYPGDLDLTISYE